VVTLTIASSLAANAASSPVLRTTGLTTSTFYASSLSELNYARDGNLSCVAAPKPQYEYSSGIHINRN
jgi:hypothetical protein